MAKRYKIKNCKDNSIKDTIAYGQSAKDALEKYLKNNDIEYKALTKIDKKFRDSKHADGVTDEAIDSSIDYNVIGINTYFNPLIDNFYELDV